MRKREVWKGWAVAAAVLAAAALAAPAPAQDVDLGPLPRPVTLYLLDRPQVTVEMTGDYGQVRATGVLDNPPQQKLRLTDPAGRPREATWAEVRSLSIVEYPSEGFPVGSYRVVLLSDPVPVSPTSASVSTGYVSQVLNPEVGGWRLLNLPDGSLSLTGQPYGTLQVPLTRLNSLTMEPIRGNTTELPKANIRLEILGGSAMALPLQDVQLLQRDVPRGTVTVVLSDNQSFTGKLLELPKVQVALDGERGKQSVPLERIGILQRAVPGPTRF